MKEDATCQNHCTLSAKDSLPIVDSSMSLVHFFEILIMNEWIVVSNDDFR